MRLFQIGPKFHSPVSHQRSEMIHSALRFHHFELGQKRKSPWLPPSSTLLSSVSAELHSSAAPMVRHATLQPLIRRVVFYGEQEKSCNQKTGQPTHFRGIKGTGLSPARFPLAEFYLFFNAGFNWDALQLSGRWWLKKKKRNTRHNKRN